MASECRAKNPATCRTHGTGMSLHQDASNDEAGKKEFFGESAWDSLASIEEQATRKVMRQVSNAFTNGSRDIEGFTGQESNEGRKKIAEILTNADLGNADRRGESAAVREVRKYFRENHDNTSDGGPSALATVRLFKSLKRAGELGNGIREEALVQARHPAAGASFEAKAEGIVSVFRKHGILGDVDGKRMDREQRSFIMQLAEQAEKKSKKPVEIMYRASDKKVSVWCSMENGEVSINNMQLISYPYSLHIDENNLAEDLGRIFNRTSYTKETRSGAGDTTTETRNISDET